ncbi:SMP-30/gluconolactonase/LRE family protein [Defluviicoccus vanus]|uniref:SMP-30/gluconolactonase/LRE family protein n=1 Tax=Defluviicoccus vanus TaxID=111831 RepID=A0A7H1MZS2_9PROT|nr:SMP-30/gluconolactonase/LRE family protein [Defluviicoccus vanus]QNT68958.1 SMP-30/gluconolactonase/LRE family protein [Defluviicoccus vanus]
MTNGSVHNIERLDPRMDALIAPHLAFEVVADFSEREGAHWLEGPVWNHREGCLLFSDVKGNAIHRWHPVLGVQLFMKPSGYSGDAPFAGQEPGANGLAFDAEGRLLICEHGDRRLRRLEADGRKTVLADRWQGCRLNSPNDLVSCANGDIYFTDPPFGLPHQFDDPARELAFSGVYRLSATGELTLLLDELRAPNGIALSPDERILYVNDGDPNRSAFLAYPLGDDGRLGKARALLDVTGMGGYGGPDGLEVDHLGTIFAAAHERVFVIAADCTPLGTLAMGGITTNFAWGEDGSTLFVTTEHRLFRLRLRTHGSHWRC